MTPETQDNKTGLTKEEKSFLQSVDQPVDSSNKIPRRIEEDPKLAAALTGEAKEKFDAAQRRFKTLLDVTADYRSQKAQLESMPLGGLDGLRALAHKMGLPPGMSRKKIIRAIIGKKDPAPEITDAELTPMGRDVLLGLNPEVQAVADQLTTREVQGFFNTFPDAGKTLERDNGGKPLDDQQRRRLIAEQKLFPNSLEGPIDTRPVGSSFKGISISPVEFAKGALEGVADVATGIAEILDKGGTEATALITKGRPATEEEMLRVKNDFAKLRIVTDMEGFSGGTPAGQLGKVTGRLGAETFLLAAGGEVTGLEAAVGSLRAGMLIKATEKFGPRFTTLLDSVTLNGGVLGTLGGFDALVRGDGPKEILKKAGKSAAAGMVFGGFLSGPGRVIFNTFSPSVKGAVDAVQLSKTLVRMGDATKSAIGAMSEPEITVITNKIRRSLLPDATKRQYIGFIEAARFDAGQERGIFRGVYADHSPAIEKFAGKRPKRTTLDILTLDMESAIRDAKKAGEPREVIDAMLDELARMRRQAEREKERFAFSDREPSRGLNGITMGPSATPEFPPKLRPEGNTKFPKTPAIIKKEEQKLINDKNEVLIKLDLLDAAALELGRSAGLTKQATIDSLKALQEHADNEGFWKNLVEKGENFVVKKVVGEDLPEGKVRSTIRNEILTRGIKATAYIAQYGGEAGKEIAGVLKRVGTFMASRAAEGHWLDEIKALRGLNIRQRELAAKLADLPPRSDVFKKMSAEVGERITKASNEMRNIHDRLPKRARDTGEIRRHVHRKGGDGLEDITLTGRAFPTVANAKGRKVLADARASAKGRPTARMISAANKMVEEGLVKTQAQGIRQLRRFANRFTDNPTAFITESRRGAGLPSDLREWDPLAIMRPIFHRAEQTIHLAREWGYEQTKGGRGGVFPKYEELLERIRGEKSQIIVEAIDGFMRSNFNPAQLPRRSTLASGQRLSELFREYQFLTKIATSPITIGRNSLDGYAKVVTIAPPDIAARVFIKAPPIISRWMKEARALMDDAQRRGFIFARESAEEAFASGSHPLIEAAGTFFRESEGGNQFRVSLAASMVLRRQLARYAALDQKSNLGKFLQSVGTLFESSPKTLTRKMKEAGFDKLSNDEIVDMIRQVDRGLSPVEFDFAVFKMVTDSTIPMLLSTRPIRWLDAPWFRVFAQFKTWPVNQIAWSYKYAIREAMLGNPMPMTRFFIAHTLSGEIYNISKDLLYGTDNSVTAGILRSKDTSLTGIGWRMANSMADGGGVGLIQDFTWGLTDWALGPTAGSFGNFKVAADQLFTETIKQPAVEDRAKVNPRLVGAIVNNLVTHEFQGVKTLKSAAQRADEILEKDDEPRQAALYRTMFRRFADAEEGGNKLLGVIADKVSGSILGPPDRISGPDGPALEFARRNIDVGDEDEAAKYLLTILERADRKGERFLNSVIQRINNSKASGNPVPTSGDVRARRFEQGNFTPEQMRKAIDFHDRWNLRYEKAIEKALRMFRKEKGLPTSEEALGSLKSGG